MSKQSNQKEYSPIIFLDIDGVLNRTKEATHIRLDDDLVERFRHLVEVTGANIVLSTYWRHFGEYITYILSNYGIPEERVIGSTPGFNRSMKGRKSSDEKEYSSRAEEIRAWLKDYRLQMMDSDKEGSRGDLDTKVANRVRFVILDDRPTAADNTEYLQSRFVHCDTKKGLTEEDVERAIRILQDAS